MWGYRPFRSANSKILSWIISRIISSLLFSLFYLSGLFIWISWVGVLIVLLFLSSVPSFCPFVSHHGKLSLSIFLLTLKNFLLSCFKFSSLPLCSLNIPFYKYTLFLFQWCNITLSENFVYYKKKFFFSQVRLCFLKIIFVCFGLSEAFLRCVVIFGLC